MAYTGTQLITNAYYASGVVARELESVSGSQLSDGLAWLNDIILEKVVDESMIPYEGSTDVSMVAAQEEYLVADLIHIDTATFVKDNVRYKLHYQDRNRYQGSYRVNNISSLPYQYYYEREFTGARVYLYFLPDDAYTMTIKGIFRLSSVTAAQDLSLTLETFWITYLRFALAERICSEYNLDIPASLMTQLKKYRGFIDKKSRKLDLRMNKQSTLQTGSNMNWAQINIGKGWVP